jgi:hypothetical protein
MSQTLIICETCRNPQCYCTCKAALPPVRSDSLLDNRELSDAIVQTFSLLGKCTPHGPEQTRLREHWWALLSERERRLSNASLEAGASKTNNGGSSDER